MVRLGSSSKPATVSIGGSSGKTTTTPAKSSSSTSSTTQAKTPAPSITEFIKSTGPTSLPAPAPSITEFIKSTGPTSLPAYESETQTTTVTPAKAPTPTAPVSTSQTPAQAIQSSIASGVNVPITPETLAARNEGLKPLSAPIPTTGLGSKVAAVATGGALKGGIAALTEPEPVKTIKYVPITAPTYSLQETLAISEAMKKAVELATPPSINVAPVPLDEIATAPAAKVAAIANTLLENTTRLNQVLASATQPPAAIDVSSKVEAALKSSLKTGNVDKLQQTTNTILNAVNKVAEQASNVAVKKIDTEKAALYSLSNSALNNLVSIANNEFNKANAVKTATDLKSAADKSVSKILEIGKAADQVTQLAKLQVSNAVKQKMTENRTIADNAVQTATRLNAITISPGQSSSSVASAIYSQLYANTPAPAATVAERMGAINDALKPYVKSGKIDSTKIASIRQDLLPLIQAEDWSKVSTGIDSEDQRRGIGKYAAKSSTVSESKAAPTTAPVSPGIATTTGGGAGARAETKSVEKNIFAQIGDAVTGAYNTAIEKLFGTGATPETKPKTSTTAAKAAISSTPGAALDINKTYVTPTGDVLPGSKISKVEFAKGGFTEYTKPVPESSTSTTISTSVQKPPGAVAVKGSVEGRVVNVDPDVYKALKSTGYKDNQIADSLASGKMGIYASNDGKVKIAMQSSVPNAAMSDSGLFSVEPFKTVKDSTGKSVPVNEWSYRKTAYLGLSDTEIGDLGQDLLNRAATLDVGSAKKPETGWADILITELGTVLQVPDMRAADSGMFTLKPLTNAQVPDPLKDPWGYAEWVSKKPYMALMGEGFENGYQLQPTVQGLIQLDKIAKDLAKPGSTFTDVPVIGGMNQYELFKNALTYADAETVAEIAKNNPRVILGAATDPVMQPVLESKLGSTEYKSTLDKAMTPAEKKFTKDVEKERGFSSALTYLPRGSDATDLQLYKGVQVLAFAESIVTEPLTPSEAVNTALAPVIIFGVAPIRLVSKAGKIEEGLRLMKASDGTIDAYRGTELVGKIGYSVDNPNIIRLETMDGKIFELSKDGKEAVEVAATAKTTVAGEKTVTGKPIIPVATAADAGKVPIVSSTAPGIGIRAADVEGGLLTTPTDAKTAAGIDISRSVTGEPITAETLAARNAGLKPIGAASEKTTSFKGVKTEAATETKFFDTKKNVIVDDGFKPFDVVDPTGNRFTIAKVRDTGVMETTDGRYLVDIDGKGNYYQVHKDYVPANKVVLTTDEYGNPAITKVSRPGSVDTWQVTYTDDFGEVHNVVTTRKITTNDDALELAVEWDARLKALPDQYQTVGSHAPTPVADEMLGGPNGYGGEMGDAGPIGGGGGGYIDDATGGNIVTGQDVSQWTHNQNWGAELRSLDNGKTWQVKDPETGNILSTTEYEELVLQRTADRSPKYDAELNTYTKLNKDGSRVYQDSAGNWVSKTDLDAERAAIARNNPTYTYGIDESKNNARTRTNSATGDVQYMDPQTGNWMSKEQFEKLLAAEETPIWNSEGGYYYFRKNDGTFEILNPYTNVRQTPEEYGKYLSDRLAETTPTTTTPTTTTPTTTTPTEYTPSYVTPTQTELSDLYNSLVSSLSSRTGGADAVADAWTRFTQTADFGTLTQSGDVSLLAKAKNGEVLTETEIARVQYLRSQMSDTARIAFDEAMGETPINIMPLSDFQNHVTASRDSIKNLSDADIKSSNLGPEKEIIVHQSKAEANMDDFLQFEEFKSASKADQDVIMDEIRYFIGEPTTTSNLLDKFNTIKSTWTAKATLAWNKIVEALKSAKELISQMPASWIDANADYNMAELILGNSKYSDILVVTGTKGPTKASLAKAFEKATNEGTIISGANDWQAAVHKFKKMDGWVVRSPEGEFSFIRKNDIVFSADEAMNVAATPAKMFFWEKPVNVPTEFKVPDNASGSKVVAINKADPYAADEAVWKGLTESGGLDFDMSKEFVKIDLLTEDGILWSTVREADKSGSFQIGRTVEIVEKDAVRVGELSGIDLQNLDAATFRSLLKDPDVISNIRAIPDEELQYLTKYLDDTRVAMVDDIRKTPEVRPAVETVPTETPSIRVPEEAPSPGAVTPEGLASEYQEAQKAVAAKTAERIATEDELSNLGRQMQELGAKLEDAPSREKAGIKSQIDGLKAQADALKNRARRLNQEVYDTRNVQQSRGNQLINGQTTVDDLLNQLDGLSVRDGRSALDEALAKSEDLKTYLRNTSREEAEQLAMSISEKLGSDRSAAEKIMGFHYQGAVGRIDDVTRAKMSATDQEYIRKAMTRQLNQNDYQQVTRIVDNAGAYQGVSAEADLGRLKLDNILDSSMAGKTDELKKLLTDKDVRAALKDEAFADEAFGKIYDVDPNVATQYQKAAQDRIIADMKADPKYNNLSAGDKKFIDEFYSKRTYTHEDMERLARIRQNMPASTFSRLIRGGAIGSANIIKNLATHPKSLIKGAFKTWIVANGAMFVYFAVEEGIQTMIQMTGWNTPIDEYMEYMNGQGIASYEHAMEILSPFNWILDNIPGSAIIFPTAWGFRWYAEDAAIGLMNDKIEKGNRAGLWIKDESCKFGPGCWGKIRPESERPAYWAQHPETMANIDGDTLRRIYDIQPDGSIGPNNLIAKGLGITDPELAKQIGLGHFISASNQGAKDTLTKEFGGAYDLLVKGGAVSEMANKAYLDAKGSATAFTIDPNAQYIDQTGKVISGKDVTDPSQIIGQVMADGTVRQLSTIGSTTPGMTAEGITAQQRAVLAVAPTSLDAATKYAQYGKTGTDADAVMWRSIFLKSDGSLDVDKLKSMYPDMTAAQMSAIFPKEAINKSIQNDLASATSPTELSKKIAEYKASGLIDENARIEQYMPADQAAIFTARQNNPANFRISATGTTISWIDDTGYPHTTNMIQSGKLLNPATGQYDIDQKKTTSDGSEYTIDPGKYAAFINSGSTDIEAFLADNENYNQTWRGSGTTSKSTGGGGGGGGSSGYKSGGSTYTKSTGETGIFIDSAGLNAEVYENGALIGSTDEIIGVEAGVHTITIKKDGYKPYTLPVQVYNGSIARKSVTLYQDNSTTTKSRAVRFAEAMGGIEAITPDHIVYAYAIARSNTGLASSAKSEAFPAITGNWAFVADDVKELIALYREA